MLTSLSLKAKMLLAFVGISMLLLVVGGIGWFSNRQVVTLYNVIATQNMGNVQSVGGMKDFGQEANRALLRAVMTNDPKEIERYYGVFKDAVKGYTTITQEYLSVPFLPGEEPIFKRGEEAWEKYIALSEDLFKKTANPALQAEAQKMIDEVVPPVRRAHTDALTALLTFQNEEVNKSVKAATDASNRGEMLIMFVIGLGFILASAIGFMFATSLAKQLNRISGEISNSAEQTSSAGTQLSAASQTLSSGSSEAAASLEETVASLEELASMVKLNADHAKEANALSAKSRDSAEQGESEITKLIGAMEDIASGSKKIEEIISVIDDIAFQTNLLALNAAVEAARAGEQGKGFAVVAEAVRALAQRSAAAAKDITTLIQDNVSKSENGARVAGQSGTVLKDIVNSVKKVADLNSEISVASQEQSTGLEQISKAMNQLDQATQGNAASSEEVAASSEEMSAQAENLADLVKDLRVLVQGKLTDEPKASKALRSKNNVVNFHKVESPKKGAVSTASKKRDAEAVLPLDDSRDGKIGDASGF